MLRYFYWRPLASGGGGSFDGVTLAADSNLTGNGTTANPLKVADDLVGRITALEEAEPAPGGGLPVGVAGQVLGWDAQGQPVAQSTGGAGQLARYGADGSLAVAASDAAGSAVTKAQLDALVTQINSLSQALTAAQEALGLQATQLEGLDTSLTSFIAAMEPIAQTVEGHTGTIDSLDAKVANIENTMPAIQAFDTDAEATAFSNARPGNIAFTRGTVA